MSEAELLEHAQMAYGNASANFAILLSVISAHLVATYTVVKDLTSSHVILINLFFIIASLISAAAIFGHISAGINSNLQAFSLNPSRGVILPNKPWTAYFDLASISKLRHDFLIGPAGLKV